MKLSVCLEFFYEELPIERRIPAVKACGFEAGELWHWRTRDLAAIRAAAERNDFEIACLCATGPASGLNDAGEHRRVMDELRKALDAADQLGCRRLLVLAGNRLPGVPRRVQRTAIVEGLRRMADEAGGRGIVLLLEALNSRRDCPGHLVDSAEEMFELVRRTRHPMVRALPDLYHLGIMEGDLTTKLQAGIDLIGHLHVGGVPGRHEPDRGELNAPALCRALAEGGYDGWVGLEYLPQLDSGASLRLTSRWLNPRDCGPGDVS